MPTPRHSHGIIYNNGEVLVFGGYQNILFFGALLGKCERYVVDRNVWEDIADMD